MKLLKITVATAAVLASPANASDWRYLTSTDNNLYVYVDVTSLRALPAISTTRPFEVNQVWVKFDMSQDKTEVDREQKRLHNINCSAQTSLTISLVSYSSSGKVTNSFTKSDIYFNYEPVAPDTIGYAIMEFACGFRSLP